MECEIKLPLFILQLAVSIDGPSKASIVTNTDREGSVKCAWVPTVPGDYRIIVKYDGISVKGTCFANAKSL